MSKTLLVLVSIAASSLVAGAYAQSRVTEHTYRLDDGAARPAATLADVSWLVGDWVGDAFGDRFEEVWNPPSAGSMVGMFKLLDGDAVVFYEIMLLVEEEGSLALKVKHFDADFTAWEDKSEFVEFELVDVAPGSVRFGGLTFERIGDNEIHGYLALRQNGELREQPLVYRRR
jgi:hypothetical protein